MKRCKWCNKKLNENSELFGGECVRCKTGFLMEDSYLFSPKKNGAVYVAISVLVLFCFVTYIVYRLDF